MGRPHGQSVTDQPCVCGSLGRSAQFNSGIEFDPELNEFNIVSRTDSRVVKTRIYHCPFCGGTTPESRRGNHFLDLSDEEIARLYGLFSEFTSLTDVLSAFGPPDDDISIEIPEVLISPPNPGSPLRDLIYRQLSETGNVHVRVLPDDRFQITVVSKPLQQGL